MFMNQISFVIPCYNEAGNIRLLYEEIHRVFDPEKIPFDLYTVDPRQAFVVYRNDIGHTPLGRQR